jgi:prolyl 4-hydroxylase
MWPRMDIGHKVRFAADDVVPANGPDGEPLAELMLETLNYSPRVFFIHNLLSDAEANDLVAHADPVVKISTVGSVDIKTDPGRTSDGTFDSTIPASQAIIKRVFKILRMPYDDGMVDGLQIVRYNTSKFYNEHMDYLDAANASPDNSMDHATGGTNRYATVFFYLNDVPEGGQTGFTKAAHLSDEDLAKLTPEIRPLLSSHKIEYNSSKLSANLGRNYGMENNMVKKCHENLSVRPKKLGAVLFYNTDPNLVHDQMTLHSGCPVIEGLKWGANLWVWDGNKSGKGVPASLSIEFNNFFEEDVDVYVSLSRKASHSVGK